MFTKIDKAAKQLGLSDKDIALLLQVTQAMVYRYRKDPPTKFKDNQRLIRAGKALKRLIPRQAELSTMTPVQRARSVMDALKMVDEDGLRIGIEGRI
jgi:predicted transcriptional regulator